MLTRRRLHFLIALLLPLMVLRGLLPAGYMPEAGDGTLRIAMCSDGIYSAGKDLAGDQATGGKHEMPSDSGTCPFASAATHAPPPAVSMVAFRIDSDARVIQSFAAPVGAASIIRVQTARGPPAISL